MKAGARSAPALLPSDGRCLSAASFAVGRAFIADRGTAVAALQRENRIVKRSERRLESSAISTAFAGSPQELPENKNVAQSTT